MPNSTMPTRFTCSIRSPESERFWDWVLLYEIHDIARFPTVQDFASYCRLVKPKKGIRREDVRLIGRQDRATRI